MTSTTAPPQRGGAVVLVLPIASGVPGYHLQGVLEQEEIGIGGEPQPGVGRGEFIGRGL